MTHQLSSNEGTHKQEARSLKKWPTARPGDKNEGLAHNTDLQIHRRCHLAIAVPNVPYMEVPLHSSHSNTHIMTLITKLLSPCQSQAIQNKINLIPSV
jgi:hypothetical protein